MAGLTNKLMNTKQWNKTSEHLPPDGKYVLVHLTKDNWKDSDDPAGVGFKVAKIKRGISAADRALMQSGAIPDPAEPGYATLGYDGIQKYPATTRSRLECAEDEGGNNLRPYQWISFGPGNYFGQEVDYWMEIPELPRD